MIGERGGGQGRIGEAGGRWLSFQKQQEEKPSLGTVSAGITMTSPAGWKFLSEERPHFLSL